MHDTKLGKVVTNYFWTLDQIDDSTMKLRPGLDLLAAILIRNSAHELLIPYVEARFGKPIEEAINEFPHSIKSRLKVIDKKQKIRNKVLNYLEPVYKETKNTPLIISTNMIFNFMYNLTLAAENEAWADVEQLLWFKESMKFERQEIRDEEARARLDQILGICNIYSNPTNIPVVVLKPQVAIPSIYERVNEILEDAMILSYSRERYLLGVPGKIKAALMSLKKWSKRKLVNRKYAKILELGTETVKVASLMAGMPFTIPNVSKLIPEITMFKYNPPLVDLDYYRVQVCRQIRPNAFPNFIMPDGATRAISPDRFRSTREPTD